MPLYEYLCKSCGKKIELMRSITDNTAVNCPDCASECTKLVSVTSFQLKGSGWYKTDYCSKSKTTVKSLPKDPAGCATCCSQAASGTCNA